jgi:nucleotide-binding universal stress UspA family protein
MMIKNILVPVDGSKYSVKAFDVALDMAKKYGVKISALHIP